MDLPQFDHDLFITHAGAERAWVMGELIPALGLDPKRIITADGFRPGASLVEEFERAVKGSRYTVLVLSPAYLADEWTHLSEQLVSFLTIAEQQVRLIPLLKVATELPLRIDFRVRLDCTERRDCDREITRLRTLLEAPEPTAQRIPCPFPGMVPFDVKDARFFFGREQETGELLRRLRVQNYLLVIGPSGSGKSSLVFAGLVAELDKRQPDQWLVRVMRPGTTPLETLTATIGDVIDVKTFQLVNRESRRVLLILDQFEELFVQTAKREQALFIAALKSLRALKECALVITMRADFYPDLMSSDLWPVEPGERLEIATLRGSALASAINKPAERVGVYLEAGLLERLIADAADEPGALPLVQETMALLWENMGHRLLSFQAYEELGQGNVSGLAVALATRADAVLAQLSGLQRAIARRIFLRLVQFGEGRADTRRQQLVSALRSASDDPQLFDQTLDRLTQSRLLTLSGEEGDKGRKVDIAHEALINGWPTMRQWLSERRVAEQTRRRLEDKAGEWARLSRGTAALLDEVELKEASDWLDSADASELGYNEVLSQLVHKSREVLEQITLERETVRQRELEQARGLAEAQKQRAEDAERLNQAIDTQRRISDARRLAAQAMFMQNKNFDLALLLSVEACKSDINIETRRSLLDLLTGRPQLVGYLHPRAAIGSPMAISPDGQALAFVTRDGTIRLWDVATRQLVGEPLVGQTESVATLAFSTDGKTLASGGYQGAILLWEVAGRRLLGELLPKHPHVVRRLTFSPDSRTLASGSDAPTIVLWDVTTRQPLGDSLTGNRYRLGSSNYRPENSVGSLAFSPDGRMLAFGSGSGGILFWEVAPLQALEGASKRQLSRVDNLAFSPDGKTLASASEHGTYVRPDDLPLVPVSSYGSIVLWNIATREPLGDLLTGREGSAQSLAFSPNCKTLASGSRSGGIQLWDVASRQPLGEPLTGHATTVKSLAFHQDGRHLRSGSEDGTILLWDLLRRQPLGNQVSEKMDPAWSLALSPDGKTLAWGSVDARILLWDVVSRQPVGALSGQASRATSLAFSPDGKMLMSAADDRIRLWVVASGQLVEPLTRHRPGISRVAFHPDGEMFASASSDSIMLWDLVSGSPLATLTGQQRRDERTLASWATGVQSVAFTPDGKKLASANGDSTIALWDVASRELIGDPLTGHKNSVATVAFSPDGKTLASGSRDDTIILWDVVSWKPLGDPLVWQRRRADSPASGSESGVLSVAFSPDSKTLASGNGDRTVALWDTASRQLLGDPLIGHSRGVTSVVFTPDGKTLAAGSGNGSLGSGDVWLWDVGVDAWKALACRIANRNLTRAEWARYINPEPFTYDTIYVKNPTCADLPLELPVALELPT